MCVFAENLSALASGVPEILRGEINTKREKKRVTKISHNGKS